MELRPDFNMKDVIWSGPEAREELSRQIASATSSSVTARISNIGGWCTGSKVGIFAVFSILSWIRVPVEQKWLFNSFAMK